MINKFGVNIPTRAHESRLLALLAPMFRTEAPLPASAIVLDDDEPGWTVGLERGGDLPRLRLSILAQPGARMTLRFDSCPGFSEARVESC
ncbi:hypothetical protein GGD83_001372 [Rhodoblastus sphagnicola]|nr:hypothetical protein [Rhodoblastus sphagnicola]MBB4197580.1 hypothetical protein [Rhodoblastus sphagnicola]